MHEMFSDWFHVVDPQASRDTITKRWAATDEVTASLTKDQAAELAVFVVRRRPSAPQWFQDVHKKHDDVMPLRNTDEELRVLAAVSLRTAFEKNCAEGAGMVAAMALVTGAFGMRDEPAWLNEHLRSAAEHLSEAGRRMRQAGEPTGTQAVGGAESDEGSEALQTIRVRVEALTESTNYLWWAFTNRSALLDQDYASLSAPVVALVAPVDVFRSTRLLPLAPETEALLLHVVLAISGAADLSLKNHVMSLGRDEAHKVRSVIPATVQLLCPLAWVIATLAEGKNWQAEFERLFGVRATSKFPVGAIAIQRLRELSLAKAFEASR
jgi:hypothetical protein